MPEPAAPDNDVPQQDVEYLLNHAEEALESIRTASEAELPEGVSAFRLEEFAGAQASSENAPLDLVRDVELDLKIELGRTHMYLEDVLKLRKGSVVPLDKLAGGWLVSGVDLDDVPADGLRRSQQGARPHPRLQVDVILVQDGHSSYSVDTDVHSQVGQIVGHLYAQHVLPRIHKVLLLDQGLFHVGALV